MAEVRKLVGHEVRKPDGEPEVVWDPNVNLLTEDDDDRDDDN